MKLETFVGQTYISRLSKEFHQSRINKACMYLSEDQKTSACTLSTIIVDCSFELKNKSARLRLYYKTIVQVSPEGNDPIIDLLK